MRHLTLAQIATQCGLNADDPNVINYTMTIINTVAQIQADRETQMEFATDDPINPDHYKSHPSGIECIEISSGFDFLLGNVIKYVWRAGLKDSDSYLQDLEKALWYLNKKVEYVKTKKHSGSNIRATDGS